jgi:hypothetical protein
VEPAELPDWDLDGIPTGIRQMRRSRPLETEVVSGLRVPTLAEMARIKAWLLATRHTVRDYLDTVALLERLGEAPAREAFSAFDEIYRQGTGASPLVEVVERLASASPSDAPGIDLRSYKGLAGPWNDWKHVGARGRHWAVVLAALLLSGGSVVSTSALERLVVGWNRSRLDLASDEVLAQVLDRGDVAAWRELYQLAAVDSMLRRRILGVVRRVALPYPGFWLAALASLGEAIDWTVPVPRDDSLV